MNNSVWLKIFIIIISIVLIVGLFLLATKYSQPQSTIINQPPIVNNDQQSVVDSPRLAWPLNTALERVTKKPFGLYITPKNSPVSPEKFTGYHTGVDLEILPGEESIDVPVYAICDGKLLLKKSVTGYGGVAVESCELSGQKVTLIYGHLKLSSINLKVGQAVAPGETIGILGRGYSTETSGERKHLHLGIHQGTTINLLGYVPDKKLLSGWLNALDYLK